MANGNGKKAMKPKPGLLGTGMAAKAGAILGSRRRKVDEEIEKASGNGNGNGRKKRFGLY